MFRKLCDWSGKTHAKHCHAHICVWQTQPFICQLIASPENSLQRRSPCWLGTWTLQPVQSVKGHICFHTEMNVYANHNVNRKKLKNGWFIGRGLESVPTITKLVLCEAGIYNLDVGTGSRLLRGLKDLLSCLLIFHNMLWIDDSHRFNPFFWLRKRVGFPAWAKKDTQHKDVRKQIITELLIPLLL